MRKSIAFAALLSCAGVLASSISYPPIPDAGEAFIAPLATEAMLLDGIVVEGRYVVVGEHGIVLISDNAGQSWTQVQTGTRALLTGVHFVDRDNGWVVGHDAIILRTRDGGKTWEIVHFEPEDERPLFDIWFADLDNGFAIGAYGVILSTEDGGDTWETDELAPKPWPVAASDDDDELLDEEDEAFDFEDDQFFDFHLNHIVPAANGDLYIAAEAGHFFRSTDDGATWFQMPTTYEGSFFSTLPLTGDELLVMGLRGNLFRSPDAGQSWDEISLPITVLLNGGIRLDDGTVLIGGMAGTLLESRDDGVSFELHQQSDRKAISVLLPTDNAIILVGEAGLRRASLDELRAEGGI